MCPSGCLPCLVSKFIYLTVSSSKFSCYSAAQLFYLFSLKLLTSSLLQHFFASFLSRDEAFRLIIDGWVQHSSYAKLFLHSQGSLASLAMVCFMITWSRIIWVLTNHMLSLSLRMGTHSTKDNHSIGLVNPQNWWFCSFQQSPQSTASGRENGALSQSPLTSPLLMTRLEAAGDYESR